MGIRKTGQSWVKMRGQGSCFGLVWVFELGDTEYMSLQVRMTQERGSCWCTWVCVAGRADSQKGRRFRIQMEGGPWWEKGHGFCYIWKHEREWCSTMWVWGVGNERAWVWSFLFPLKNKVESSAWGKGRGNDVTSMSRRKAWSGHLSEQDRAFSKEPW